MIKTPILSLLAISLLASVALAEDAKGVYVRVDGGITSPKTNEQNKFKSSAVTSAGIGYQFNDMFKTDINWQMRKLKVDGSVKDIKNVDNSGVMVNGYINLTDSGDWMIPYFTAGIGYGTNKIKGFSTTNSGGVTSTQIGGSRKNMMWNIGVGIAMEIVKNLQLDLAYRYTDLGKAKGKFTIKSILLDEAPISKLKAIKSNEFTLGLIYNF